MDHSVTVVLYYQNRSVLNILRSVARKRNGDAFTFRMKGSALDPARGPEITHLEITMSNPPGQ